MGSPVHKTLALQCLAWSGVCRFVSVSREVVSSSHTTIVEQNSDILVLSHYYNDLFTVIFIVPLIVGFSNENVNNQFVSYRDVNNHLIFINVIRNIK